MARFFLYASLAVFLSGFLGSLSSLEGPLAGPNPWQEPFRNPLPYNPVQKKPALAKNALAKTAIAKKGNKKEAAHPKKLTADGADAGDFTAQLISLDLKANKKKGRENGGLKAAQDGKNAPPDKLRPLRKKIIILDARRLKDHKFTETIRYIKEHPDMRLRLQNMTIDPDSIVSLMKGFKDAKVIDQIRDISFVMLPGANNQVLNEKAFIDKVLPYLGHLEGINLSCLGVSDKVVNALAYKTPHLKNLSLFGIGITDATVSNLSKTLPNLRKIHLTNTSLTSKGIQELIKNFPYLRALGISGQHLKDSDFNDLKDGGENIYSFSMVGQTFKEMKTVKHLLSAMPRLHTLDLSETNVTDDVAKFLGETVKGLKVLDISETPISRSGLRAIVENLDLTTLKINNLKGIGKSELILIADRQPGLRKFYFSGAYFDNPTIISLIHKLPKLIDITLIPHAESPWIMSEEVAVGLHLKEPKLQYLRIPAKRLPEVLRVNLERNIPALRIEYEG